jgi:heat shock protein HtpX
MYSQIAANKRNSFILVSLFILILVGLGAVIGKLTNNFEGWIFGAVIVSLIMTLFSYFAGDKVALAASGAKEIKKEDNKYLWNVVENLSITSGMPMPKVYIIPDNSINAFATGRNPQKSSIAITVGALSRLGKPELEGVIAHELSHVKNYDIRLMMLVIILVGSIALMSDWFLRMQFFRGRNSRDREEGNIGALLFVVGIVLAILSPVIAQLIQLAVSRQREFLADASGAMLTRYPEGLAMALEKIAAEGTAMKSANNATAHLYISDPFGKKKISWLHKLFMTHPPLEERIARLRSMGI